MNPRVPPRRHSLLRRQLFAGLRSASRMLGGRRFYRRRHLVAGRFLVREERVVVPGLASALEGLTIAQLSDLHAGPWMGPGDLADVVAAVNARRPDLVVLTGDYLSRDVDDVALVLPDLAQLAAPRGAFAVLGNHDYRGRREGEIVAAFAERGIRVLRDENARVALGAAGLGVVGVEDLEEAKVVDLERALHGLRRDEPFVALCHHPAGALPLARRGAALVLSGHTHGTQIDLPAFRRLGPAHPGLRVELGDTVLLVSRGLGAVGPPLRVHARTEVVVATLTAAR